MLAKLMRLPAEALKDTRGFIRHTSRFFVVRMRPNKLPHSRFAVIVSLKTDRSSVGRHRLKRRIVGHMRSRLGGQDTIITVLPAAKDLSRKLFLQEIDRLL